ncbi:hypothetical protein PAXRUDRAFT_825485 [Paxillus rubicundulus Ve08.2h10]|uniref:Nucleoporin Nup54 alpha-helical domain-containing protein n=1 Tax=Paxillus rubicundulus Ve08.2h10 TaxID=930991 RepID=A0A0D0E624_9AGAM|nr:hypothetical protein PAXRUDRAFT_825485 [Paxillus rubicundulus Ve08.2h10]
MSAFGSFGQNQGGNNIFASGTNTAQQGQTLGTGTSLFGNPASATAGGTVFGNSGTMGGGSLFGNTQQQQPAPGNIFGNPGTQQQPATGTSLFGNPSSAQQQLASGGSIFGGNATSQQPTGGSMFGATTQSASDSLFGNTNTQQQQQPAGGSFFGGTNTQQQQPGGSFFGTNGSNSQQQPVSGSLFGSATNTTQPTASPFGNSTTQAPAYGGGLFGSSTTSSNPLFGNKSPASIFGTQASSTTTSTSTITPPSLFGQPVQQQEKPNGSMFGSTTQPPGAGSLFGSALSPPSLGTGVGQGSFLGTSASKPSSMTIGSTSQQQDPQSQFTALTQRIDVIAQAWDPNSPQCRFQHYFYNLVDPSLVSQYGRPANATNEALWQRAVRENPDARCMVPVVAVGFDAVNTRVEAQSTQAIAQQEKLKELKKRLQALTATHTDTTLSRTHRALSQHTQLSQRLLRLIQHLHLLIPAVRSSSIRPEEEALRVALEDMEEDLRKPGGTSKMRSKLNELWALVGAVNAARERGRKAGSEATVEWTVVDEEGLKQITQVLSDQQTGLQHLTKILQRDLKDLGIIMGKNGEGEDSNMNTESKFFASTAPLYGSTSTLR